MNLKTLETLIAVEELGGFTPAAHHQHMTVSAVSMQMKALEGELNAALFDRSSRPPTLTPLGRRVATEARQLIAVYDGMADLCRSESALTGDFAIGFVLTASVRILPLFLQRAQELFPDARFRVVTGLSGGLIRDVADGRLDAAVVTELDRIPDSLNVHLLRREPLAFCLPGSAKRWSVAKCMERLPFIHFMPEAGIGTLVAGYLAEEKLKPANVIVLDSVEAVVECVRAGVGFSILPEPDIARQTDGDVVIRQLGGAATYRDLVLVTGRNSAVGRRQMLLAEAMATGAA
ncbi:MAG: LysR family transcriptional regulator [Pseudomonadota bacterium]